MMRYFVPVFAAGIFTVALSYPFLEYETFLCLASIFTLVALVVGARALFFRRLTN